MLGAPLLAEGTSRGVGKVLEEPPVVGRVPGVAMGGAQDALLEGGV